MPYQGPFLGLFFWDGLRRTGGHFCPDLLRWDPERSMGIWQLGKTAIFKSFFCCGSLHLFIFHPKNDQGDPVANMGRVKVSALKVKSPLFKSGHPTLNIVSILYAHLVECYLGFVRTDTRITDQHKFFIFGHFF